ncbi:MAG: hypothetical protein ACI8PZ_000100 [Myxococcota bacterium]
MRWSAVAALPFLIGCVSDIGLQHRSDDPVHAMEVYPPILDLGERDKGDSARGTVKVRNPGDVDLVVRRVELSGSAAWGIPDGLRLPVTLRPGQELAVSVRFAPDAPYKRNAELLVRSDAPAGESTVELRGRGSLPVAVLDGMELGEHAVGCVETGGEVWLSNTGGHDLKLYEVVLAGDDQLYVGELPSLPATVVPGGQLALPVGYAPVRSGAAVGTVEVRTNDLTQEWSEAVVSASAVWASPYISEDFDVAVRAVDILLAVDRSASMRDDNERIHAAFEGLVAALPELAPDFRVGVVTGISACFNDTLFTPETPEFGPRIVEAMQGEGSALTEALLGLARDAVVATEDCNAGFLRPGSPLQLVVVSDEPEQSGAGWEPLVDELRSWLADPQDLHVSGVVDANHSCGDGATGYLEAAAATDGVIADVCGPDLSEAVLELLVPSQVGVDLFPLGQEPVVDTLSVWVDGMRITGWSWDPVRLAVRVDEVPEAGARVTVEYRASGC